MGLIRRIKDRLARGHDEDAQYPFAVLFSKFQDVLSTNNEVLELIADMGDKLGGDYVFDRQYIFSICERLSNLIHKLIIDLNALAPGKYIELLNVCERINHGIQQELAGKWVLPRGDAVIPYSGLSQDLNEEVGNKNAHLAEVRNVLELATPDGFAITTGAFQAFLELNGIEGPILQLLESLDVQDFSATEKIATAIQERILGGNVPHDVARNVSHAVEELRRNHPGGELRFAVRSSAWGEDSAHSFAGQYRTFLNVPSERLLDTYREVLASAYSPSALVYRQQKGFLMHEQAMAVGCQIMVDAQASGVVYTLDPYSPEQDRILITATWGLGAPLVEGETQGDQYLLNRTPPHAIAGLKIVHKTTMFVSEKESGTESCTVPDDLQSRPCLSSEQLQELAEMSLLIERYFKRPQDIEWALDRDSHLVILQTRALNIKAQAFRPACDIAETTSNYPVLMEGRGVVVQRGVATGKVFVLEKIDDLAAIPHGSILVARHTSPRLARIMRKVHGIITDVGSPTGHMATIAREFRVPTVVNTKIASHILRSGEEVTLDATQNVVYAGRVKELCYYEFTEEDVFEESYEYRLLRRILRRISPLYLLDPHDRNFTPSGCKTLHDIVRFIHEKAVEEVIHLEHSRHHGIDQTAKRLKFEIPLGLILIDIGGGLQTTAKGTEVAIEEITSIPMRAFLKGLTEPGMWSTQPMSVDFGSFMSSLTRTFSSSLATPTYVGQNLAVVSRQYFDLSLRLGYHFNIIDAYISENLNDNYAYFRFLGGVTDMIRRSRRAKLIAEVLERFDFLVEVRGDLVVGRVKKLDQSKMEDKMSMLGCLVAFTRQLDVQMHSDEYLDQYVEEFFQRTAGKWRDVSGQWESEPLRTGGTPGSLPDPS
jgi:pyruvate,water dikinase